jgi:hypothetical protein
MPIDFIDQLSNFEKLPLDIRIPFVIGVSEESTNTDLQAKDVVITQWSKNKIHRSGKSYFRNNKGKTISATVRDQKGNTNSLQLTMTEC